MGLIIVSVEPKLRCPDVEPGVISTSFYTHEHMWLLHVIKPFMKEEIKEHEHLTKPLK